MQGSIVALITPFDAKGNIDWKSLEKLLLWHIEEGTDGIVSFGTTGEGINLSTSEKKKILSFAIDVTQKKLPIIANTGSASTRESVQLTEAMLKLGAQGCLAVTPYYNKPTQQGCIYHYEEIAKVGLPVIVYNNPARVGVKLELATIVQIAQIPGIYGYKDSTADLHLIRSIKEACPISIFSGDDDLTYATMKMGAAGAISVIGNLFPGKWKALISSQDETIHNELMPIIKALFLETNPQGVKFAMSQLGLCKPYLRLPLIMPRIETQDRILKVISEAQIETLSPK